MTNFIFVLLFVLYPPPEVVAADPTALPLIQTAQVESVDDCKAKGAIATKAAGEQFPGAHAVVACLQLPAPDPVTVKPGLQPDGNILTPDGDIVKPRGPI